jgi:hypothetical protein
VKLLLALLCVVLLPAAACGGRAEEAPLAWAALQHASTGVPEASCVHFRRLQAFLPRAPEGFRRLRATASTGRYGEVSVSEAEQVFVSGDEAVEAGVLAPGLRQLSVRIVDSTLSERIAEAIRTAAKQAQATHAAQAANGQESRTAPLLYDRAVGYVSHDQHDGGRVEAMLLVGERFLVSVTGHGFSSGAEARAVLGQIDVTGLAQVARPPIALGQVKGAPW